MDPVSRRDFLTTSGTAAATASLIPGLLGAPAPARAAGSNERIRIGFIGPGGRGFGAHVKSLCEIALEDKLVELVAVSDVYKFHSQRAADYIQKTTGRVPKQYEDYVDLLADKEVDAVCIGTPDHWHARQTIDAMKAGKHVFCEKPMTHTVEEAMDVLRTWHNTGKVMQVGVQSTSLNVWDVCREKIAEGMLGKVLMYQTEYFRNSRAGQWRDYVLTKEMTPQSINWPKWLGVKEGLAPDMPFDREIYAQWRRFWWFGSGMYTDLFVHRTTTMLKATGLRFPRRVVGAGGIFMEYDGRDVPDVATVVADFPEGVQGLVTATMCSQETRIPQVIRGHFGSFVFGNGEDFTGFDFVPERPQVTHEKVEAHRIDVPIVKKTTSVHFKNWLSAIRAGKPEMCNNPPDLGAAAIVLVNLGSRSYREGKAFFWDAENQKVTDADASWAKQWEQMSKQRAKPHQTPGWKGGDKGSLLEDLPHMALAGPWINGEPPKPRVETPR